MNTNGEARTEKGERFGSYSPHRRTALVLSGTGTHGAYHAGVLRALHEAGVKLDVLAGHGVGAASAALAAIDGAARLWDANGVWRSPRTRRLYGWTHPVMVATGLLATLFILVAVSLLLPAVGVVVPVRVAVPMLLLFLVLIASGVWIARRSGPTRRRAEGPWWWRLAGAPVDAEPARELFGNAIWELIRGAAPVARPSRATLGRRYSEVLRENLGQPGFREIVLVATDLDARRDLVAALLSDEARADFMAPRPGRDRHSEVLDLTGVARDHSFDLVAAGLTPHVICDPALVTFAADSFWRGETHRLCDRPGTLNRLLEEVAAAGVTQAVVVSAVPPATEPHRLRVSRLDLRHRLGDFQSAAEAAALRDALEMARLRFDAIYLICPAHNPVGPFDVDGAYDEASDRRQDLQELMERAYEDAYRQFIEPVIGASGEQLARVQADGGAERAHVEHLFDDVDASRLPDLN